MSRLANFAILAAAATTPAKRRRLPSRRATP
jgi:hypothetical protein